jgi:hypothetical protein
MFFYSIKHCPHRCSSHLGRRAPWRSCRRSRPLRWRTCPSWRAWTCRVWVGVVQRDARVDGVLQGSGIFEPTKKKQSQNLYRASAEEEGKSLTSGMALENNRSRPYSTLLESAQSLVTATSVKMVSGVPLPPHYPSRMQPRGRAWRLARAVPCVHLKASQCGKIFLLALI